MCCASMAISENLTSKRQKFSNEGGVMVNDILPEHVLTHILSLLPTKEAIKTSVLSKRWRLLWTTVSNLDFSDHNEKGDRGASRKKFINYVDTVLLRLDPTKSVDKFSISLKVYENVLQIKKWISSAIQRNVKDLTLSLTSHSCNNRIDVLPRKLFDCKSVEALTLHGGFHLKIPQRGFVCFPNLKFLSLRFVSISGIPDKENSACFPKLKTLCLSIVEYAGKDDSVMKLIRNCPLLVDLSIRKVLEHNVSNVDMCIPQLTSADLVCGHSSKRWFGLNVQIEAPIKYLGISRWNPTHKIVVKNLDSLISAEINSSVAEDYQFQEEQRDEVLKLLKTVDKVKCLTLSMSTVDVIKASKIKLPLFGNLTQLEVLLSCKNLCMVETFLNSAVNLQSLVVRMRFRPCRIGEDCIGDDKRGTEFLNVPKCLISSLKRIEIISATDCPGELDMIKNMLKSAEVLEELTTKPSILNKRDIDSLRRKLSAFPRASASCQFNFPKYFPYLSCRYS